MIPDCAMPGEFSPTINKKNKPIRDIGLIDSTLRVTSRRVASGFEGLTLPRSHIQRAACREFSGLKSVTVGHLHAIITLTTAVQAFDSAPSSLSPAFPVSNEEEVNWMGSLSIGYDQEAGSR